MKFSKIFQWIFPSYQKTQYDMEYQPSRTELLSPEQLKNYARTLASEQKINIRHCGNCLLDRLNYNDEVLREFNKDMLITKQEHHITPATEWLVDNFYLIEEHVQLVRRHLPRQYSLELPCLAEGRLKGIPRIYSIVLEFITQVDAQVDESSLRDFIEAYQSESPLTMGELWAIPIMLRLALIENLQRIATNITKHQKLRDLAKLWVDKLQSMVGKNSSRMIEVVADMAKSDITPSSSFVSEFCQRLSSQNPQLHIARNWLEQRLNELGYSIESSIQSESQSQAATQLSVSYSIRTLRAISTTDWKRFVEQLSLVERILAQDPEDVYSRMDFASRDRYRHEVENLGRKSEYSEESVAMKALQLAKNAHQHNKGAKASHVGFYLVGEGQRILHKTLKVQKTFSDSVQDALKRSPLAYYAGTILLLSLLGTWGIACLIQSCADEFPVWGWALIIPLLLLTFSQLAVSITNRITQLLVGPHLLSRLDFSEGIPDSCRTVVAIPTMLSSPDAVDELAERLELHFLANQDNNLYFALLTDFNDASEQVMANDDDLLLRARNAVAALNAEYFPDQPGRFYLFHRPRLWNASENLWMGYERKRGKLEAFNDILMGTPVEEHFSATEGDIAHLESIKYVITLDSDTQLPRDKARKLVGTMTHPLNHAEIDSTNRVVKGYGILQPRMACSLRSNQRSRFARLFSGDAGIDPYTQAVSDVYQDLFEQGSFVGKGIYDVAVFNQTLKGRFPENRILSHDLIESCYARSALVSNIELYEDFPSGYNMDAARRHRWIRGDWQIARWILPKVPLADNKKERNPLCCLSRWKLFDNLRRSLFPPALLILLVLFLVVFPQVWWIAPVLLLTVGLLPAAFGVATCIGGKSHDHTWGMHLNEIGSKAWTQIKQCMFALVLLPYEAYLYSDAILRATCRQYITRKHLLQWRPFSDVERSSSNKLAGFYRTQWFAPAVAVVCAVLLLVLYPSFLLYASPVLVMWALSPVLAWFVSQPIKPSKVVFSEDQTKLLRRIARKTWHFFDTFVNAEESWLPPDNFQEIPEPTIASRTSPTNIGMALLANVTAHDFGYISAGTLLERTELTFSTMQRLKRFHNHFYNWYDTRTLDPLPPLYISSVDSGNLAGHLLTLEQAILELRHQPTYAPQMFIGLLDTLRMALKVSPHNRDLTELENTLGLTPPTSLHDGYLRLKQISEKIAHLESALSAGQPDLKKWIHILQRECASHLEEIQLLAPWAQVPLIPSHLLIEDPQASEVSEVQSHVSRILKQLSRLDSGINLEDTAQLKEQLCIEISNLLKEQSYNSNGFSHPEKQNILSLLGNWLAALNNASEHAKRRIETIENLAVRCNDLAQMDFSFLYDSEKKLFTIGYNVTDQRRDISYYDLLASESRLGSYVAVAQGQVPQEHWFSLSRLLVVSQGDPVLLSWSGSMFEYLMPLLVMPNFEHTLLAHTCKVAVEEQIAYGKNLGVPWGISESGYNRTDTQLIYQYRAFGIPSLGLKRGLSESLVIAPYATLMALMISPHRAITNLQRLSNEGREGQYGYYEAIDYTPAHLRPDETSTTVYSFMSHHQGMGFLAIGNLLHDNLMHERFMACPILKAAELLLQERISRNITANRIPDDSKFELQGKHPLQTENPTAARIFTDPDISPELHLLSNGRYHVMLSNTGSGYSRWNHLAVTRWREDPTRDCWGMFVYLRDLESGKTWSITHQPTQSSIKNSETIFTQAYVEYRQRYLGLEAHTCICVSPEDDIELRRIKITNHSRHTRTLELTSYSEVVIAPQAADKAHPAFSNLFVQTEFQPDLSAIYCTRRPRSEDEKPVQLVHLMLHQANGNTSPNESETFLPEISCETDRSRFIGRGNNVINPEAMKHSGQLSNTQGSVLDPIVSLRRAVEIVPGQTVTLCIALGIAKDRQAAESLAIKYQSPRICERAFELAWTHSQVTLHHLNATETEAQLFGKLASSLLYAKSAFRAPASVLKSNTRGQSDLWSYGISGDVPLTLLRVSSFDGMTLVRQLVQAHAYWRMKGLTIELLILNEDTSVYRQSLHEAIVNLISSGIEAAMLEKPGGIFVRRVEQVPREDLVLLQSFARVILDDGEGSLAKQLDRKPLSAAQIPELTPSRMVFPIPAPELPKQDLVYANGFGGFTRDGREYIITLQPGQNTPAPWCNVIANDRLGTVISENGSAYTWSDNAHSFRITPWHNDPVQDTPGEALYIRDEQTGQFWSPTPLPARGHSPYTIRHGFGYTVFEHTENGIYSELCVYVDVESPVKLSILKLKNLSGRSRKISVTGYYEWVLSDLRAKSLLHVQTHKDLRTGALLARNRYNGEFAHKTVFLDVGEPCTYSGDRLEFIGQNGHLSQPAAMKRSRLSGKIGAGLDPCGAVQITFDMDAGEERLTRFRLGVADSEAELQQIITRFQRPGSSREALERVWEYWNRTLGTLTVETPDQATNILANGWLLYQTLASRIRGRSGFYQSGGAYGFRDQLQDVMALVHSEPAITRAQILRAASRQFHEGDVQHWWHPPTGRGVRTQFSDDYLWLPYVTCHYVTSIADTGILDEQIPFIEGRKLRPEEESYYDLPTQSEETASLYEHCKRSIQYGLKFGTHGLPLIGCGDWNDGMNLIGQEGRGESVWLAFFLYDILIKFAPIAQHRGDEKFADQCLKNAKELKSNIEKNAWDGHWYRRAYFDNGEPLGSSQNPECKIDSLPQSWSVISQAGAAQRSAQAMAEVYSKLVNKEARLIQLFTPPFDRSPLNPGYIKGYIPGVRENGGQYTHAAIWTTMAFALMGETEKAWELFSLINPVLHGQNAEAIKTYKVEPYVVAADVYGVAPHTGRGGWTWYTGSASWMYRLITDTLLGVKRVGNTLQLTPRMPQKWMSYKVRYRFHQSLYIITFHRITDDSEPRLLMDDKELTDKDKLPLNNDSREHIVEMWIR